MVHALIIGERGKRGKKEGGKGERGARKRRGTTDQGGPAKTLCNINRKAYPLRLPPFFLATSPRKKGKKKKGGGGEEGKGADRGNRFLSFL